MYDTNSSFPDVIDDLVHFSDVSYSKRLDINGNDIEIYHKKLLDEGSYTSASEYLNGLSGVTLYVANLFNMIVNRIKALQEYLLDKGVRNIFILSDEKPTTLSENTIWTSGGELIEDEELGTIYNNAEFEAYDNNTKEWSILNLKTSADCVSVSNGLTLQDTLGDIKGVADSYDIDETGYITTNDLTNELLERDELKLNFNEGEKCIEVFYEDNKSIPVEQIDFTVINKPSTATTLKVNSQAGSRGNVLTVNVSNIYDSKLHINPYRYLCIYLDDIKISTDDCRLYIYSNVYTYDILSSTSHTTYVLSSTISNDVLVNSNGVVYLDLNDFFSELNSADFDYMDESISLKFQLIMDTNLSDDIKKNYVTISNLLCLNTDGDL